MFKSNKVEKALNDWVNLHFSKQTQLVSVMDGYTQEQVSLREIAESAFMLGLMQGVAASHDSKIMKDANDFFKRLNK